MTKRDLVIYIAGPYRAATTWGIAENIQTAKRVALEVWRAGFVALCPHANTSLFDGELPDDAYRNGDLTLMERCDAVLLLDGWERSSGTREEVRTAKRMGLPVFESLYHLGWWADERVMTPKTDSGTQKVG
jgi:nucleoside 2-deoxyribosyltransferase